MTTWRVLRWHFSYVDLLILLVLKIFSLIY
jgi:hypothetical protein